MIEPILAPHLRAHAQNFAARLAPILRALALLAGYRFARHPILARYLAAFQHRLHSAARRMTALMDKLAEGHPMRPARPSAPRPARPKPSFPAGKGWLLRALPSEALLFLTRIDALLAEPEIAAILAMSRRARRILAPIQRALSPEPHRGPALHTLIPQNLYPPNATPPSAIPPFLLYPTPIPPKIGA